MTDHERIWLEPAPGADEEYGRQWCQHNVWGDDATEYVRSDLVSALERERDELKAALEPFAEVGERVLSEAPANATMFTVMTDCEGDMVQVSLEYFRSAIRALSSGRLE